MSIREFSKHIYFSHSLYGQVEIGKIPPTDRILQLIISKFNVNRDWLLSGNGNMFDNPPPDIRLQKIIEIYNIVDEILKESLFQESKILLEIHQKFNG